MDKEILKLKIQNNFAFLMFQMKCAWNCCIYWHNFLNKKEVNYLNVCEHLGGKAALFNLKLNDSYTGGNSFHYGGSGNTPQPSLFNFHKVLLHI